MAKIFGIHVALMRGIEVAQFAPGDEVPEWALDLVGDHCLKQDLEDDESDTGLEVGALTEEQTAELARLDDDGAPLTPPAKGDAPLSFTGATEEPKKPAAKARGKKA